MISYFKKHFLMVCGLLIVSGGIAVAQQSFSPISLAPNADRRTYPVGAITRDGQVRSAGLSIGKTTAPAAGYLLDVAGDTRIVRDHVSTKHNCVGGINSTNGNNKCYRFYSALFGGITTPRALFPEFISTSLMSAVGGVVVSGISDANNTALTNPGSLLGLTPGTKLDITGTIQGDPSGAYMNHATGLDYPGNNCSVSTSPACKKYACIASGTGNIVSCQDPAEVQTSNPARPQCSDGIDNDGDSKTDGEDMGCWCTGGNNYYYNQTGTLSCGSATESSTDGNACTGGPTC